MGLIWAWSGTFQLALVLRLTGYGMLWMLWCQKWEVHETGGWKTSKLATAPSWSIQKEKLCLKIGRKIPPGFASTDCILIIHSPRCADRGTLFCIANTFGQTGRIAADQLEPILEDSVKDPFLKSQVRNCSSSLTALELVWFKRLVKKKEKKWGLRYIACAI